jgi:hypothetical protein
LIRKIVVWTLATLAAALVAWIVFVSVSGLGDESPPPGIRVVNDTSSRILVYMVTQPGERKIADMAADVSLDTGITCLTESRLEARLVDGTTIDAIGPLQHCRLVEWVVEGRN